MLRCFNCEVTKPLDEFNDNRMKYKIKYWQGKCFECRECSIKRAIKTMTALKYNFDIRKFETFVFANEEEVYEFYKNK